MAARRTARRRVDSGEIRHDLAGIVTVISDGAYQRVGIITQWPRIASAWLVAANRRAGSELGGLPDWAWVVQAVLGESAGIGTAPAAAGFESA